MSVVAEPDWMGGRAPYWLACYSRRCTPHRSCNSYSKCKHNSHPSANTKPLAGMCWVVSLHPTLNSCAPSPLLYRTWASPCSTKRATACSAELEHRPALLVAAPRIPRRGRRAGQPRGAAALPVAGRTRSRCGVTLRAAAAAAAPRVSLAARVMRSAWPCCDGALSASM